MYVSLYYQPPLTSKEANSICKDEPELQHGAPTSIQVFTNKMRDEECLHVATIIDECLKKA
jgi:amidase